MIDAKKLGGLLFSIHTHAELVPGDEIVYREKDLIEFLKKVFGAPEPEWGEIIPLEEFGIGAREMEGALYEIMDGEGNSTGIIWTDDKHLTWKVIENVWSNFWVNDNIVNETDEQGEYYERDADSLASYLRKLGYDCERVFTEEVNC